MDELRVIIGSRLHGLSKPSSDTDMRGVFMFDSVLDFADPYYNPKDTRWIEGATHDDTATELGKFCYEAAKGSPTALETLFSNKIIDCTEVGYELQHNAYRFIDSRRVFEAHKGYAHNQYAKMNLFESDARTPKFAVAYARSLVQGIELLRERRIVSPMPQMWPTGIGTTTRLREFLYDVKYCPIKDFGRMRGPLSILFAQLQQQLVDALSDNSTYVADTKWISAFVRRSYARGI